MKRLLNKLPHWLLVRVLRGRARVARRIYGKLDYMESYLGECESDLARGHFQQWVSPLEDYEIEAE